MSEPTNKDQEFLRHLLGLELSAVVFVRDYIQLQFDGPVLTVVTTPEIETTTGILRSGQLGFRDALCDQISHTVKSVDLKAGVVIGIAFTDGGELLIPLQPEFPTAAEAITLDIGNDFIVI